jgi:hypothetical protein
VQPTTLRACFAFAHPPCRNDRGPR